MFIFDTETCGFTGPCVLIQWSNKLEGGINLYHVWHEPVRKTMEFIERICNEKVIGFNLAYDWFHINKLYTVLSLIENKDQVPYDNLIAFIDEYLIAEEKARHLDICVKPHLAHDIFLHARKGPYQSTMERKDIRIRKVPKLIAEDVVTALEKEIVLSDLYFARKSNPKERWTILPVKDPNFVDLKLTFAPSAGLKALYKEIFGDTAISFKEAGLPKEMMPKEYGFAPYASALGSVEQAKSIGWPSVIKYHIDHWYRGELAKQYATDDVMMTQKLYKHFDEPECGDDDSTLACLVACCRWRGYAVDTEKLKGFREIAIKKMNECPVDAMSTDTVRQYIQEAMSPLEAEVIGTSTKGMVLEYIATWTESEVCDVCSGMGCETKTDGASSVPTGDGSKNPCKKGLVSTGREHPAAIRANHILIARHAKKEIELYDKLIRGGRFHASFKVIGTLSSRMAGADGLNPQGIKNDESVRRSFPLAEPTETLTGGDFDAFEVKLMDASYGDPVLREELQQGKKIHALFGALFFNTTYDEIMATSGKPGMENKYKRSKSGVFALFFGGDEGTLARKVGINEELGRAVFESMGRKYKVWAQNRQQIFDDFCSMVQEGGIGSKVVWREPADYIESLFGFRRYFTMENMICKVLFDLANNPPKHWGRFRGVKLVRRDREQTVAGATRTALFACAFGIQAANMRAAANHVIQSSGATITKRLQCNIWTLQPTGVHNWIVRPLNIHDEVMCPTRKGYEPAVKVKVDEVLDYYRSTVPLIEMEWHSDMKNWAEK